MLGKRLGNRYEILRKLGGGGMALVFKAKDTLLNRFVTVKMLRDEYAHDEDFVGRFRQEAQAVASLSHPNIVNIFDVGYEDETHYIVMEYVEGNNLKEIIRKDAPFSVERVVDIVKQICDGIEHAHENNVIHRDIKPHNILVTETGRVKVADFGLARAVTTSTVTHTKTVLGSVHYFSPEQAKGELTNEKSDIYSLGVVMYEMLTGEVPFVGGESPISIALKHIETNPVPPREINPDIPEKMETITMNAMAKNVNDRYSSVSKLRDDLKKDFVEPYIPSVSTSNNDHDMEETKVIDPIKENYSEKEKPKRKIKPLAYALLVFMIIGVIGVGMWWAYALFTVDEVNVPDVSGLSLFEANHKLTNAGLQMEVGSRRNHPEIEKERIISQNPKADSTVKENRVIAVVVSEGPLLKEVPNVVNFSKLEAEIMLQNQGFEVEIEEIYDSTVEQGDVIRQSPRQNSQVSEGSEVIIEVSKGIEPRYIPMPDLTGLDLNDAKEKLEELHLGLESVSYERSTSAFEGEVISQNINANSLVLQNRLVELVVSSGPGPDPSVANVRIPLPRDEDEYNVRIIIEDRKGERVVYNESHPGGRSVSQRVEFYESGTISVYRDAELVLEQEVP